MAWTLDRIETRVRAVTGWTSEDDLSETSLREAINYIYTRRIPYYLNWDELQQWVYLDLADGDSGEYDFATAILDASGGTALGSRVRYLEPPFLLQISDDSTGVLAHTENWNDFWNKYPPYANESDNQPVDVLQRARTLFVRPKPDDTYVIKVWASLWPTELSDSVTSLVDEGWGEIIIPGAIAKLNEDDEDTAAGEWWPIFFDRIQNEAEGQSYRPPGRVPPRW